MKTARKPLLTNPEGYLAPPLPRITEKVSLQTGQTTPEGIPLVQQANGRFSTPSLPHQTFASVAALTRAVRRAFPDDFGG